MLDKTLLRLTVLFGILVALTLAISSTYAVPRIPRSEIDKIRSFGINPLFDPEDTVGAGTVERTECKVVGDPNTDINISCDDPIAVDTSGRVHGVWTDMRRAVTADGRTVEDAFYARR